jgi:uncharacterized membrane protein
VASQQNSAREAAGGNPVASRRSPIRRLQRHASRRVVTGFLLLVPLGITVWVSYFVFSVMDGVFRGEDGILRFMVRDRPWDFWGVGVVITLFLLYITGAFLAGKRVRRWEDALLSKIPIFGSIYSVSRQSIDALSSSTGQHFSRVVFVDWPRPGTKALGFVTGHLHGGLSGGVPMVVVYIPTVPNPTSGMLTWVPEDDVINTDITVEDAMKTVFSGGIVLPDEVTTAGIAALTPPGGTA